MKALFITSEDLFPGFRLAGITQIPSSGANIIAQLEQIVSNREADLVIVDECLLTTPDIQARFDELALAAPLQIATLPRSTAREDDYARRMIIKTIGYSLQL